MLRWFGHRTCSFICLVNFRRILPRGRKEITSAKGTCGRLASRRGAAGGWERWERAWGSDRGGLESNLKATKTLLDANASVWKEKGNNSRSLAKSKSKFSANRGCKTQREDQRSSCCVMVPLRVASNFVTPDASMVWSSNVLIHLSRQLSQDFAPG